MQGHVLSPTTRQEIHLITCEAEDGGGLTEEDCVPRALCQGEGGEEKAGGEQWQWGKKKRNEGEQIL